MRTASVRDLHLKTSAIVKDVAQGESFVIEKQGVPVAELRPVQTLPSSRRLPNREALLAKLPVALDSGRILEEDRT
jgi:antitoxin (DNA-binding transcriptional repressor) of toxin-antitoxin stability system